MEIRVKTAEEFRAAHVIIEIKAADQAEAVVERLYTDDEADDNRAQAAEDWEAKLYADAEVTGPLNKRIEDLEGKLIRERIRNLELERKAQGYDTDRHTEQDRADRERKRASELKDRLSGSEEKVAELEAELERQVGTLTQERDNALERVGELEKGRQADHREIVELRRQRDKFKSRLMDGHVCTAGCTGDQHVAFVGRKALTEAENQVADLTRRIDNARALLTTTAVAEARTNIVTTKGTVLADAISKALDTLA